LAFSRLGKLLHLRIKVKRAFLGMGALGKVAGIVGVINTGIAEGFCSCGAVERNARMTMGFERCATNGTGDRLSIDEMLAARTSGHGRKFYENLRT